MFYVASITFTSASGKPGRRQFLVDNPSDIVRCGVSLVGRVGGDNVRVKGWKSSSHFN